MTVAVGLKLPEVSDLHDPLRGSSTAERPVRRRLKPRLALARLNMCRRHLASSGNRTEAVGVAKVQITEPGFANSRGVFQYGFEDWLQLAGRTADDFQHLRCRSLLLQRFSEV